MSEDLLFVRKNYALVIIVGAFNQKVCLDVMIDANCRYLQIIDPLLFSISATSAAVHTHSATAKTLLRNLQRLLSYSPHQGRAKLL